MSIYTYTSFISKVAFCICIEFCIYFRSIRIQSQTSINSSL